MWKARKWAVAYSKPIVTFKDTKRTNELISNISNKRERKEGEFLQKVKREIEEQEK